ncbi:unnamed protein product [Darwinula stevensoni]|uniref:Protein lin-10 n=1 Tax=Darwinula stevensoni TaxID=69355 RepID=A0A7R9A745_9CRUS|nr:unnamed protein product [Darwinula stevensoni]CAG0890214.1 unnamed protein product [Darwinula stevensoni]
MANVLNSQDDEATLDKLFPRCKPRRRPHPRMNNNDESQRDRNAKMNEEESTSPCDESPPELSLSDREKKLVEAGAKEVFSHSRMQNHRKRYSDEWSKKVKHLNPGTGTGNEAWKRHSGEVTYEAESGRYDFHSDDYLAWLTQAQRFRRGLSQGIDFDIPNHRAEPPIALKETIFSSEIRTLHNEYRGDDREAFLLEGINSLSGATVKNLAESLDHSPTAKDVDMDGTSSVKVARVIGNVPIAEYEGSPRKYGRQGQVQVQGGRDAGSLLDNSPTHALLPGPTLTPLTNCKPGFPRRVNQDPDNATHISGSLLSLEGLSKDNELLYEFSETRKVLDEFFGRSSASSSNFVELEYQLRRNEGVSPRKQRKVLNGGESSSSNTLAASDPLRPNSSLSSTSMDQETTSEDLGETEVGLQVDQSRNFTLSPDTTECDPSELDSELSYECGSMQSGSKIGIGMPILADGLSSGHASDEEPGNPLEESPTRLAIRKQVTALEQEAKQARGCSQTSYDDDDTEMEAMDLDPLGPRIAPMYQGILGTAVQVPPPAPHPHRGNQAIESVLRDIKDAMKQVHPLHHSPTHQEDEDDPVWIPRMGGEDDEGDALKKDSPDDEDLDTDQETDRLLGQQRGEDAGFDDDKVLGIGKSRTPAVKQANSTGVASISTSFINSNAKNRASKEKEVPGKKKGKSKEGFLHDPAVLIEGVLFRARYLGSTQLVCEGQPTKSTRMIQAEEAVSRIKVSIKIFKSENDWKVAVFFFQAPDGESQPSTEVDLFISTEKIMVLNTDLKEIMMDHALRSISYIADIGDLVVLMARRRITNFGGESGIAKTPKMICHVFESEEAQFIAQSIGQAFQVAYLEFLKANGIEDHNFVRDMDYQEVLNSQEIFGDELQMFAKKENQKEVIVPKGKGEILGVVVVESGWGSMLPTVVIANMCPNGPAARCGHLNIGDQIITINGVSLVGLPLSTCQQYIKNAKNQTVVKLTVVPCPPVVEVKIKRPDTKYQLGFSVQNGVICSLLRGGIAERGGVRVGHRIIEINNQSVVAVPHERIVNLLATSVGELKRKSPEGKEAERSLLLFALLGQSRLSSRLVRVAPLFFSIKMMDGGELITPSTLLHEEEKWKTNLARLHSKISPMVGRPKPIDLIVKYVGLGGDAGDTEMDVPYRQLEGLSVEELEELRQDIEVYKKLDKWNNARFWTDMAIITEGELMKRAPPSRNKSSGAQEVDGEAQAFLFNVLMARARLQERHRARLNELPQTKKEQIPNGNAWNGVIKNTFFSPPSPSKTPFLKKVGEEKAEIR